jgi:hypothetical protein
VYLYHGRKSYRKQSSGRRSIEEFVNRRYHAKVILAGTKTVGNILITRGIALGQLHAFVLSSGFTSESRCRQSFTLINPKP